MTRKALQALIGTVGVVIGASLPLSASHAALLINPFFAPTYTGANYGIGNVVSLDTDPAAEAAITRATQQISSQFSNDTTVNILYYGTHGGAYLGASIGGDAIYPYAQYTSALAADAAANPLNKTLAQAAANLGFGNGASDPLNSFVLSSTADSRALGLGGAAFTYADSTPEFDSSGDFVGSGGSVDGIVFLNLDVPLAFTRPLPSIIGLYDAESAMQHETDEILGIGGGGSTLNQLSADPNFASDNYGITGNLYGPMDLYRYWAPGVPSYDGVDIAGFPDFTSSPYFSVDGGVTAINFFNQLFPVIGGDAGDWAIDWSQLCPGNTGVGGSGSVQDAFTCNNVSPNVSLASPEGLALQSIGYNPVPEPITLSIFAAGVAGAAAMRRRKMKAA